MQNATTSPALGRYVRWSWMLVVLAMCLPQSGCTQIVTLGYLIGGPPSIEPDFDAKTNVSLKKKGKKVLVMCYAPKEVKWDFDSVDRELGRHLSHRLAQ